ncbi:MAG: M3 family metallopeptidase [Gammaproteobacteria bacterium]|nr:M3 family metallopeptidase [Gammaproteobacteria bacterium]
MDECATRSQYVRRQAHTHQVFNNCNFTKGDPTLLDSDEVRTVFHEFGHALHGLLSKVSCTSLSGTRG